MTIPIPFVFIVGCVGALNNLFAYNIFSPHTATIMSVSPESSSLQALMLVVMATYWGMSVQCFVYSVLSFQALLIKSTCFFLIQLALSRQSASGIA